MQLRYEKNLVPYQDGMAKVCAIVWSPNNKRLAVATSECVVLLFDDSGEKKDKFATKPVDAKYGKKSYTIKGLAFSPDSTKLAVGQSDNIVFVYKIGENWNDKKVICNKFLQQSAVTCLTWPTDQGIIFGLMDGKVRLANVKTNKSSTLYATGGYVVAIAPSPDGKAFLSGHADGSIVRYSFDSDGGEQTSKLCTHPSPPYCLIWSPHAIVAAGCDKRVVSYSREGRSLQQFDYSREPDERDLASAAVSPAGQSFVIGSFDRIRVFNWNTKRGAWEEGRVKEIKNMYTIACLVWKYDGSKVVAGTLCGGVEMFDCSLKRTVVSKNFEVTHVGPSQVIVKNRQTGQSCSVRSEQGWDIQDVKVMGRDRYVLAYTPETIIFADMDTQRQSEIVWQSGGNEKFYFENENVCLIFNAGELSIVEYGVNELLAQVRTEFMNPHLISVRTSEREQRGSESSKKFAYLLDLKTIAIMDLAYGSTIGTVNHDAKVDWLELNGTGKVLLFRDKRSRLAMYNVETDTKSVILNYCTYVQWVPGSDVAVAQSRSNLCVWYNITAPEQITMIPIKGDVCDLVRENGVTEVIVQDGAHELGYALDEGLIEFGTAMDDADFGRAVAFLESKPLTPEIEAMWKQLAKTALEQKQLRIAERCYAGLNDIARARYLNELNEMAMDASKTMGGDGTQFYKVRARLAIMERQFKEAEQIYLEQNGLDEALEMYQEMHKWEEALELAESRNHPDVDQLKAKYLRHLAETGQDDKAGELREREGDFMGAIDLYLKSNMASKAAQLVIQQDSLASNAELVQTIAISLIKSELYGRAGELFEKVKDFERALECYRKGNNYDKAVDLARYAFPQEVIKLEEAWGDHLVQQHKLANAVNHYIEGGQTAKALDCAIKARDFDRATELLKVIEDEDPSKIQQFYGQIAPYYAMQQDYDKAERYFVEAGMSKEAIEMYNKAGRWEDAHRLATQFLQHDESSEMYLKQAKTLEEQGRYREAEKLYVAIQQPQLAIAMYKEANQYEHLMRLVSQYQPDRTEDMQLALAKELEESGKYRDAERHYLAGKEWKSAASMYRNVNMWEDAHRVAKAHGGEAASKQVAYHWAKSLGGDSAVKLLTKFRLLEDAIDSACDNGAFDFAFELCRLGLKSKLPAVHLKQAQQFETEGHLAQAEQNFIQGNSAKDAMMMYIQRQDWDNAQRIAEKHVPDSINEVYAGQAQVAFDQKDYAKGESYYLRAKEPEKAVEAYKRVNMWQDAMRICQEYTPNLYPQLQKEFDHYNLMSGAKGAESFVAQAKDFEAQHEYALAAKSYLKICSQVTHDKEMMRTSWTKAGEIAAKFVLPDNSEIGAELISDAVTQLKANGFYTEAANVYIQADMGREAVETFVEGADWKKAKKLASQIDPGLEADVDRRYKEYLRKSGNAEQLASVDVLSAIDMLVEKGDWQRALQTAKQQPNAAVVEKYVALFAAEMIRQGKHDDAIEAMVTHGAAANSENFAMYESLFSHVCARSGLQSAESYETWARLRNMLLSLNTNMRSAGIAEEDRVRFEKYLIVAHLYAIRSALMMDASLAPLATRVNISLVRYSDLIPVDKAFYEAGNAAKQQGGEFEDIAFVFLNHYLDLYDAIEEKDASGLDYSGMEATDIPTEVPLPEKAFLTVDQHEEVKEYVLAVSVDKGGDSKLPLDRRGVYEASLVGADGTTVRPCVITGYPVVQNEVPLGSGLFAIKDYYTKFQMAAKVANNSKTFNDVLNFISAWSRA